MEVLAAFLAFFAGKAASSSSSSAAAFLPRPRFLEARGAAAEVAVPPSYNLSVMRCGAILGWKDACRYMEVVAHTSSSPSSSSSPLVFFDLRTVARMPRCPRALKPGSPLKSSSAIFPSTIAVRIFSWSSGWSLHEECKRQPARNHTGDIWWRCWGWWGWRRGRTRK